MKMRHNQRRQLENRIMQIQEVTAQGKAEIASSTCEISKETRFEIDKILNA